MTVDTNTPPFKIYVGMALSDAPEEFRTDFHDDLKGRLREIAGIEVLDFFWTSNGPTAGDDVEVYELDEAHAQNADLFVAILDHPSTGLGMEIIIRHSTGKPTLFLAKQGTKVSRMPIGYLKKFKIPRYRYASVDDIIEKIMVMKLYHELLHNPF